MSSKKIITGIRTTGDIHLGNYFAAIKPIIKKAESGLSVYLFLADLHSLTSDKSKESIENSIKKILASYVAFGLDKYSNVKIYRQSEFPEVGELQWILSTVTPLSHLELGHAYKSEKDKINNAGLLMYPVLMAADILIADADLVLVGPDQKQHIELAREIVKKFNNKNCSLFSSKTFKYPLEEIFSKEIVGTDGRKMSKSYNNTINIFDTDHELKKSINKIITSSIKKGEAGNPDESILLNLLKLFGDDKKYLEFYDRYKKGDLQYSELKTALYNKILDYFKEARERYFNILKNDDFFENILARDRATIKNEFSKKIQEVKKACNLEW